MLTMKEPNEQQREEGVTSESMTKVARVLLESDSTDPNLPEPVSPAYLTLVTLLGTNTCAGASKVGYYFS